MENTEFVRVSEAIASAILERERVHPAFLHRNPDNSITAIFDDIPEPAVYEDIRNSDDTIVVLKNDPVAPGQSDEVEYNPLTAIRFAFTAEPTDYS